ncbi:Rpn family recombination-promoting nuclease/putative transposase [uncultured Selenomonas sp.]|uniref:Rpn family recombination-promoting nuclease/putative transposase n=1 Tax=uncultured Selenomonas sp. TaxID=159275 RepID=UPI0028DC8972|nr:Rpn family recombination-promoting nuclease/putative transposase [uncultured Selenomonas sp.]
MKTVNRNYKDSLFRDIFNNEERLAEIYTGLLNDPISPHDIQLTTLDWTFFTGIRNDVSFIVKEKHIVLLEHQSTCNENMPLRLLMYIAEIYRRYVDADAIYRQTRILLPAPKFYVFYNGEKEMPAQWPLRLSDAFDGNEGDIELVAEVININEAPHRLIFEKCRALKAYSVFVAQFRGYVRNGKSLEEAVSLAVRYCVENDYLGDYFRQRQKEEVFDMMNFVWNQERALEIRAEEAMQQGMEKGMEKGMAETQQMILRVFPLLRKNMPLAEISEKTGCAIEYLQQLKAAMQ